MKHRSNTQTTVALSFGDAELHGIAAGMAQGIGLQALARDLRFEVTLSLHSDATAAIGIARKPGMGKIRHLDCTDLWIQETNAVEVSWVRESPGHREPGRYSHKIRRPQYVGLSPEAIKREVHGGSTRLCSAAMGIHQSTKPDYAISNGQ